MSNEKYEEIQGLKDELFKTKDEASFNEVVKKIGDVINADPTFTEQYKQKQRDYINNLREKKKEFWKKYPPKNYTKKEVYLLREETEKKIQQLLDVLIAKFSKEEEEPEEPEHLTNVTQYPSANEGKLAEECDYPIGHKRIGFKQYENNR